MKDLENILLEVRLVKEWVKSLVVPLLLITAAFRRTPGHLMFDAHRERYVALSTFRKDGREVKTPVWIAAGGGKVWVYTHVTSGKVKRIRNNGRARVAPSDGRGKVRGDWVDAKARLIEDPEERERGLRAFVDKYGWQMRLGLFLSRLSGRYKQRAIIELEL